MSNNEDLFPVGGMNGRILVVDLTKKTYNIEKIDPKLIEDYIGGRGLGAYYLNKLVDPKIDPLSADNKLIFMNGPLAGSLIPGNNKVCVTFKSPLTNSYSYSLCGGHWGPELKFTGFDGLIIEGKSEKPVYLWIHDKKIEIKDADGVWGSLIPESEEIIRSQIKDNGRSQIAVIGPAGEKLNKYSTITSGLYREFGRGGAGTIMGSKNLKAIALLGSKDISFSDLKKTKSLGMKLITKVRESGGGEVRRSYGTPEMVKKINDPGFLSTRNFNQGHFEKGFKLEGPAMRDAVVVGDSSCYGCPVGCGKRTFIKSKKYGDLLMEGPEFETLGLIGANCGISDWDFILKATEICDKYGFDTMNAGGCVSLAMEAFEKGLITTKDTDGIDLSFGNGEALIKVIELMAKREGIGKILTEGARVAAEHFGDKNLAMESKGQVLAVYDPRGCTGMGLTYATSPKGAHHMIATTMGEELGYKTRLNNNDKGELQRRHQFSMCICDSIAICSTMRAGLLPDDQAEAFSTITGIDKSFKDLQFCAERIINLERLYNVKMGFSRKDDTLPERFIKNPLTEGESKENIVELEVLLDEFYEEMGWDSEGVPKDDKVKELGLKHA